MTKKKKIIAIIVAVILSVTLITTAIVVIMAKRFKVTTYDDINYINHSSGVTINLDAQYKNTTLVSKYQNGTELVQNNNNKYGLFSNISGQLVVGTNYDRYVILDNNETTNKTYFKFYNSALDGDGFIIYDEHGNKIFNTHKVGNYTRTDKVKIIKKTVDIDDKYDIEEDEEEIQIKDIDFLSTFYREGKYHYECWQITDTNDIDYINLYKIDKDSNRELIQTLGNSVGNLIDDNIDYLSNITFLENGDFVFVSQETKEISNQNTAFETKIYNEDLELLNTVNIKNYDISLVQFKIGNHLFLQEISTASEDKHDFAYDYMGERIYYNLTTHKINLKNGKYSEIKCNFVINSLLNTDGNLHENTLNPDTTLANAYVIDNKEITNPILMLVDKQLKYTEITKTFDKIEKISKNRYLISDNDENYALIDKNYKILADFSKYSEIFTTKDNIIASDNTYTYICTHDGIVLNKYQVGSILNVHNKDFYMIIEENTDNNTVNYIRGNNGEEYNTIITISNSGNDTILENLSFNHVNTFINDGYAYILASKIDGSNTTYTIFNFEGSSLVSTTIPSQYITPSHFVYDNHVIIEIADTTIVLNK